MSRLAIPADDKGMAELHNRWLAEWGDQVSFEPLNKWTEKDALLTITHPNHLTWVSPDEHGIIRAFLVLVPKERPPRVAMWVWDPQVPTTNDRIAYAEDCKDFLVWIQRELGHGQVFVAHGPQHRRLGVEWLEYLASNEGVGVATLQEGRMKVFTIDVDSLLSSLESHVGPHA